jgi:hypothetical protein
MCVSRIESAGRLRCAMEVERQYISANHERALYNELHELDL